MGPELLAAGAILSGVSTVLGGVTQYQAMNAQAEAGRRQADMQGQWQERQAQESRAAAQRGAARNLKQAAFAQSRLKAVAGASGSGVDDPTVMDLWGDVEKEGRVNAGNTMAAGEQKAAGLNYQADLGRWGADANGAIKEASATGTLIGGLLSGGGRMVGGFGGNGFGAMSARYADPNPTTNYRYG